MLLTASWSSYENWLLQRGGCSLVAVFGLFTAMASVLMAHRLERASSCVYGLSCMWDLPGPGMEPVSLALVGRFFTTEPLRKPKAMDFFSIDTYKSKMENISLSPFFSIYKKKKSF